MCISFRTEAAAVSTIEMEVARRLSTYRRPALPLSARPRGPRLFRGSTADPGAVGQMSTRARIVAGLAASILATRSLPKAVSQKLLPSASKAMEVGWASALLRKAAETLVTVMNPGFRSYRVAAPDTVEILLT